VRPSDPAALLGLAQALDAKGGDPFAVRSAYERAYAADERNEAAQRGLADARLRVAPALELAQRLFADSDELRASLLDAGPRLTLPHALVVSPLYRLRLYRQDRVLVGDDSALAELNDLVAANDGSFTGQGLGLRAQHAPGAWSVLGEAGYTWYQDRSSPTARTELRLRTAGDGSLALAFRHDDAITEVNTVASLAADVSVDLLQASAARTLAGRLRLFGLGALAWYSGGSLPGRPDAFAANRQYRVSLGTTLLWGPARVGYVFRHTGFDLRSPLYFSPSLYRVHALQLAADGRRGRFEWGFDAQGGLAEVERGRNEEWAVLASAGYRPSPRTRFVLSGRISRSSEGIDAQRPYHAQSLQLGLERLF
jgi:hypothetical protein